MAMEAGADVLIENIRTLIAVPSKAMTPVQLVKLQYLMKLLEARDLHSELRGDQMRIDIRSRSTIRLDGRPLAASNDH